MEGTLEKKTAPTATEEPKKEESRTARYGARKPGAPRFGGNRRDGKDGRRPAGKRAERPKPEFDQKIISIRRVTRVVAGGRRFSFSVALVAGDKNGSVGVGVGKASDTALAIEKAFRAAKSSMVTIKRTEDGSIPHDVEAKYTSSHVTLRPAKGKGLTAGSSVRTVLEFAGIKDVSAKLLSRSKNQINNARATMKALEQFGTIARKPKVETRSHAQRA